MPNRPSLLYGILFTAGLALSAGVASAQAHPIVASLCFERFKSNMEALAEFGDRSSFSEGNPLAEDWLEGELQAMGYDVERMPFAFSDETRDNIWATKVGTVHPDKMHIVSAHLDGRGGGGAVDDDASGTSLVLEIARALAGDDVLSETSVRFILWNIEEAGLIGSQAYVEQRASLQGVETPPGSGLYPEPTWLGIIQHDMILYDHGVPPQPEQIPGADLDIEYKRGSALWLESKELAEAVLRGNVEHSTDYPAQIGDEMCCTDSVSFDDLTAAVSVRENRGQSEIGVGSNPHQHQPTDVMSTFSEADFRFGFNDVQMTLGAIIELAGVAENPALFDDGFEDGDTSAWSITVGVPAP
ncbi:MAG: M28 family peptidase [Acidobacteriota bacterium]